MALLMVNISVVRDMGISNYSKDRKGSSAMCIYCQTQNYRKIYENHYGPIPKDHTGRRYDIHHKDGNRNNNDPLNLIAVSIYEHFYIHYAQSDWHECWLINQKIKMPIMDMSAIAKKHSNARVKEGTHHFLKKPGSLSMAEKQLQDGTHPSQTVWTCEHCNKTGKSKTNYIRWHQGAKCLPI